MPMINDSGVLAAPLNANVQSIVPADVTLSEVHLSLARQAVAEAVGGADGPRLAFASGSLAAGLGHGLSDVDVHLLPPPGVQVAHLNFRRGDHMVEMNPLSERAVKSAIAACSSYELTARNRWQLELDDESFSVAVRLAIGTVLEDVGFDVPAREVRLQTIRRVIIARCAHRVSALGEDAIGARQSADLLTALGAAKLAVQYGLDAILAAAGDVYISPKFLYRRCARSPAVSSILGTAWELLNGPAWPPSAESGWPLVMRGLEFASSLVAAAQTRGWDAPIGGLADFPLISAGSGPRRSPGYTLWRFRDDWGMAGPDRGFRVTEGMVRLWVALDGRPLRSLIEKLKDQGFGELTEDDLAAAIEKLAAAGAVITGSVAGPNGEGR